MLPDRGGSWYAAVGTAGVIYGLVVLAIVGVTLSGVSFYELLPIGILMLPLIASIPSAGNRMIAYAGQKGYQLSSTKIWGYASLGVLGYYFFLTEMYQYEKGRSTSVLQHDAGSLGSWFALAVFLIAGLLICWYANHP